MNKVANEIDFNSIKEAVMEWACRIDDYDGAIGGVIGEIPWSDKIQSVLPYDEVADRFSDAIPCCPHIDMEKIIHMDKDEHNRLNIFANKVATDIVRVYTDIIDNLNKKIEDNGNKKTFKVNYSFQLRDSVEVKAYNEAEAKQMVEKMLRDGYIGNLNEMDVVDNNIWVD